MPTVRMQVRPEAKCAQKLGYLRVCVCASIRMCVRPEASL